MKITELRPVSNSKRGKYYKNGVNLNPHEERTIRYLNLYGYTINAIRPVKTPKMRNPDILLNGAIWEIKSPTSSNKKTIKKRMHEASEQATQLIIDLRRVKRNDGTVEKEVVARFHNKNTLRSMILITKQGKVVYYKK